MYPPYRSFSSDLEWDHAHNDYAEALAETGIAGAVVILSALGLFVCSGVPQLGRTTGVERRLDRHSARRSVAAGCWCMDWPISICTSRQMPPGSASWPDWRPALREFTLNLIGTKRLLRFLYLIESAMAA